MIGADTHGSAVLLGVATPGEAGRPREVRLRRVSGEQLAPTSPPRPAPPRLRPRTAGARAAARLSTASAAGVQAQAV
jgi:hypothetical protein